MTANYWHGKNVRLRGIELSDTELFYRWNLDSERARRLDFVWPPSPRRPSANGSRSKPGSGSSVMP